MAPASRRRDFYSGRRLRSTPFRIMAWRPTTYTLQTRTSTGCQAIACHNLGQGGYPPDAGIASDGVWRVVINNAGVYVFDSSATRKHFFTWCAFFIGHP